MNNNDVLQFEARSLRTTDSNSLLRMYDVVTGIFARSSFQQERARADRAIQRIVKELERRKVPYATAPA